VVSDFLEGSCILFAEQFSRVQVAVQYKKSSSALQNIFLWYVQFEDAEVAMPVIITHIGLLEIHSDSSCTTLRFSTPEVSQLGL